MKSGLTILRIPPIIRIPPLVIPKSGTRGGILIINLRRRRKFWRVISAKSTLKCLFWVVKMPKQVRKVLKFSASGGKTPQNTIKLLILLIIAPKARKNLGSEKLNYKNPPLLFPNLQQGGILNIVSPDILYGYKFFPPPA